ncbi:uncharacterized protein EAF01_006791 [Botrytis porri]|uniref:uncharacterized protein n=1 Tax=Botrytis porri TaxID=87229 RepID=UPI001900D64D|nr:uncharacterized protein EAF01_006791 [Botrytis porri]KAF7903742.1 hypothetical protein EAF01_006791 [Botrytis porri]
MFRNLKKTLRKHASGKKQSEDGEPLLAESEQHRPSHQGTHQSNVNASPLPFLSFGRHRKDRETLSASSVQETRVPQTNQYAPLSSHRPSRHNRRSTSRSIRSDENSRLSTSTRAESVVSSSGSHCTTSNMNRASGNPRVVILQGRSSRDEHRPSSASRDEPPILPLQDLALSKGRLSSN